jgi:uncharacterized alpha-E superfamily protein
MGRYIERAEGTARLLLEFHQLLVQERGSDLNQGATVFLQNLGVDDVAGAVGDLPTLVSTVYGNIADGAAAPTSIVGALESARANARSIRDALPADFFEVLNRANDVCHVAPDLHSPGAHLREVLGALAIVHGTYDWIATRDESYNFYEVGSSLERLDLVSRLLNMRMERTWVEQGPATMLRSVGALSAYLRRHERLTGALARSFLATEASFPRSLRATSASCRTALSSIALGTRVRAEPLVNGVGLLETYLSYWDPSQGDDEISQLVNRALMAVESTSEAVRDTFFRPVGTIVWSQ